MSSSTSLAAFGGTRVFVPDVEPLPPPVIVDTMPLQEQNVAPAGPTICIRYPGPIGRMERRVSWVKGKKLQYYLKGERLIGTRMRCRLLNGQGRRIRMAYVPEENEVISLVRAK